MPRRRFQRGRLIQRGKIPMWVGMFREDRLQPTFKRIRRTVTLGPCSNMSRRAPLAALQPYLDAVNVASCTSTEKSGQGLLGCDARVARTNCREVWPKKSKA